MALTTKTAAALVAGTPAGAAGAEVTYLEITAGCLVAGIHQDPGTVLEFAAGDPVAAAVLASGRAKATTGPADRPRPARRREKAAASTNPDSSGA